MPSKPVTILSLIAVGCAVTAVAAAGNAGWLVALSILFLVGGTVAATFWALDRRELKEKLRRYGEAEQFLAEAAADREAATAEAAAVVAQASNTAQTLQADAEAEARRIGERAAAAVCDAETRLVRLTAEHDACLRALDSAQRKLAARANDLVIPARSLLDTLPEPLALSDAGQRLKQARAFSRQLVKSEQSAATTESDPARAKAAARFITDAFNGKIDSLLTRIRHEPYAALRQEAMDTYNEVNLGATPFKTRITEAYLDARLDEIKWAALTYELKVRERDLVDAN